MAQTPRFPLLVPSHGTSLLNYQARGHSHQITGVWPFTGERTTARLTTGEKWLQFCKSSSDKELAFPLKEIRLLMCPRSLGCPDWGMFIIEMLFVGYFKPGSRKQWEWCQHFPFSQSFIFHDITANDRNELTAFSDIFILGPVLLARPSMLSLCFSLLLPRH